MTATTIRVQMAQRKDTAANWTSANPILLSGEIGYETDTKKFKIGNGSTNWNSLAYLPIPDGSGNLTITGNLEIGSTGSLTFEGSTADAFETTLAVTNPTADRTITLPDRSGTVITSGDTGTITSTMLADGTIVNEDVNAAAAIAGTKISPDFGSQTVQTTGIVSHALGSAAAPTVTFTGDTNTGIYSPGADQVAISTGGSGRLFINSNGDVGVGTGGTQGTKLHAVGGNIWSGNFYEVGRFQKSSGTAISLGYDNSDYVATVGAYSHDGTPSNLSFWTYPGSGAVQERLRITSAGLVGVGTSTPNVTGFGGATVLTVSNTASSVNTGVVEIQGGSSGNGILSFLSGAQRQAMLTNTPDGQLQFWTGGASISEKLRITSAGLVGIGSSSPSALLTVGAGSASVYTDVHINGATTSNYGPKFALLHGGTEIFEIANYGRVQGGTSSDVLVETVGSNKLQLGTNRTVALTVDTSQRVGIGTTTPVAELDVNGRIAATSGTAAIPSFHCRADTNTGINLPESDRIQFIVGGSEAARFDASSRFLVGTSSVSGTAGVAPYARLQIEGNSFSGTGPGSIALRVGTAPTSIVAGNEIGQIAFAANNNGEFARIDCIADATAGTNDYPGRLVFSTTADGASSPTERMRITNAGLVAVGVTAPTFSYSDLTGVQLSSGRVLANADGSAGVFVNRKSSDGDLVLFAQDGTQEGSISVSGTTVSYNGAHLSRWSQLPGGAERTEILRGTVLSNIDEMCAWGNEDNEQLNRMKVSDVEGDPNVSGVFQAWDDDDDTYTDDFYCAMTGDFIIRISAGIPVHRGQLLMSAGDGTAKPQDDDIVRSKTIAKVTSNHITCTYDDGSYCVPCVLMAC